MAEVFRAESEGLQGFRKQVAIKRVLPHLSEKKKFIAMFLDEARLSAILSHSNCVQVFDIGVGDAAYFIVMEFVDGANLKTVTESLKKQGKEFPVPAAAFICHEICKGLAYAHELRDQKGHKMNIVHRDMSPPNVLITKYGEVKIVDFGLAKATSQLEKSEPGIIKGKFSYLSPEAAMGQEVDARADIFAVGIILWEMLAQQRLFLGDTDFQTVKKVQQAVVPAIGQFNARVPKELEQICYRALARDPAARYQTAQELGNDLLSFMFAYGQSFGTFDVATLVQGAMRERARSRPAQPSIIDKLIEEALLEFTSLGEDGKPQPQTGLGSYRSQPPQSGGADPLLPDQFVDPTNWANEISIGEVGQPRRDAVRSSLPPQVFEQGNLSALEDMDSSVLQSTHPSAAPSNRSVAPGDGSMHPSGSKAPVALAGGAAAKTGPNLGVMLAVVVIAAAALAALLMSFLRR